MEENWKGDNWEKSSESPVEGLGPLYHVANVAEPLRGAARPVFASDDESGVKRMPWESDRTRLHKDSIIT